MPLEIVYQTKYIDGMIRYDGDVFVAGAAQPFASFRGLLFESHQGARRAGARAAIKSIVAAGLGYPWLSCCVTPTAERLRTFHPLAPRSPLRTHILA